MLNKTLHLLILLVLFSAVGIAQQVPTPTPVVDTDDVVKITTNLVQFDAVVTDKNGRQVQDLTAADFIVLQDGKQQKITNLSYVNTESPATAGKPKTGASVGVPPAISDPRSVEAGRLITFVVDDGNCSASQLGMIAARESLEKFVKEQMFPADRVAIYTTRSGSSMLQRYTSDKALVLGAAKRIRWYPNASCINDSDGSFYPPARPDTIVTPTINGVRTRTIESEAERKIREAAEDFNRSLNTAGALGVLRYIIRGLEPVPGRKVVFFMSDGMPIAGRDGKLLNARDVLRDLTDAANRSSVVFNTIDVRGVFDPRLAEARDDIPAGGAEEIGNQRSRDVWNSREGLSVLAEQTGGRFYQDQNFLDGPIRKALNLEKGYYLIAYEPDDETFKGKNFNQIEIKLTRPELRVSSRAGFLGKVDRPYEAVKQTGDGDLYRALVAPLPHSGLDLRLTAYFVNGAAGETFVRSMTHIDGDGITFTNDANGTVRAVFDVVAVTLNEKNDIVDDFRRTHTFKIDAAAVPLIKRNGLIYSTDVPVKNAGTYNFRVAMRDANGQNLGSASQMLPIPDIGKGNLAISALTLTGVDSKGKFSIPSAVKPETALSVAATGAEPAVRRFQKGAVLAYAYTVYNPKLDKTLGKPSLSIEVKLYRDGQLVMDGKPAAADLANQSDWSRINDFGYFRLDPQAQNGDYALQVIVTDMLASGGKRTSSQWIDFEVE